MIHIFGQKKYSTFAFLFLVILSHRLQSQNTGKLYLGVAPSDAVIRVDTMLAKAGQTLTLSPGTHRLQLWAPTYEYIDTTVNVPSDSVVAYKKLMHYSPEYIKYLIAKKEIENLRKKRTFYWVFVASAVPVVALTNVFYYPNQKRNLTANARGVQIQYQNAIAQVDINKAKEDMKDLKRKYLGVIWVRNSTTAVFSGTAVACVYFAIRTAKKYKNSVTPVYQENSKLSNMKVSPYLDLSGSKGLSFTLNF